jgi:hypothetical protein
MILCLNKAEFNSHSLITRRWRVFVHVVNNFRVPLQRAIEGETQGSVPSEGMITTSKELEAFKRIYLGNEGFKPIGGLNQGESKALEVGR